MVARDSLWRFVLCSAGCLVLGAGMGIAWSRHYGGDWEQRPLWHQQAPTTAAAAVPSFADVVDTVRPGVVAVHAQRTEVEPAAGVTGTTVAATTAAAPRSRSGSGFVVDRDGLVVTSRHVVVGASSIEVLVPGLGLFRGELVGEDRATDLALLRLPDADEPLPALALGDSGQLRAGDWIVALGNPYGFDQTVSAGIVSFVGRHLPHSDFGVTNDFLQVSAPVHPGSSGCPVVDLHGRVVGVTTQAAVDAEGISFAVPSNTLKWTLAAMRRQPDGRVRRGYLGIEFATRSVRTDQGAAKQGALIVRVAEGQPADRAGLRVGDIVLEVDGQPVADATVLHERIVCAEPGTPIALQLLRDGMLKDPIVAVLGEVGPRRADTVN